MNTTALQIYRTKFDNIEIQTISIFANPMATLFDAVSILQGLGVYNVLLPFILILALVYGALTKFHPFGESKEINAIISFVLALIFVSFMRASTIISTFSVFITGFLVIILMLMMTFMFLGVKGDTMAEAFKEPLGYSSIIIIFVVIFFIVFSQVFPEGGLVTQAPEEAERLGVSPIPQNLTPTQEAAAIMANLIGSIIFSPPVLALIILLLLFGIAAYFITRESGGRSK